MHHFTYQDGTLHCEGVDLNRIADEVGTPWCITVDGETKEAGTVTLRDRDSMAQERVPVEGLVDLIAGRLGS